MKNIHLIPTDKPSRLHCYDWSSYGLSKEHLQWKQGRNIYITSDEEIKEGIDQWYLDKVLNEPYNSGGAQYSSNQNVIILTTDLDLIKEGVQAIDDGFLEWFVKNPSCEEVKIESWQTKGEWDLDYKIIIPKEEPTISEEAKQRAANYMSLKGALEPKQETLEEAAEKYAEIYRCPATNDNEYCKHDIISAINFGAKWQQKNSYSEKDMIGFAKFFTQYTFIDNTLVGDLYALDETGNHPAYTIAELISIWKKK